MKIKFLIFCVSALVLVNLNISRAESLQYSVQEKSKKDDSLSTTIETINWNFTEESFKTRETWNNFKDTINCQVKLKDIQKCEILRKDAQDDLTKSKTYIPFSLSLQLKSKLPICQRIFEEDSKNSTQVFSFLKIDMPLDTEARGKEISERLNCPVADKSSKKVDKDTKEESSKKLQGDQSIKEIEIKKAEEARLKQEEMAKKKEEAALKKQEALAKKAEEARLKQEEAAAKQAEISTVKEDDMALKEQEAKITEEARLKQEEMAKKKEEAALKKQEALAKKAEEARLKQEEMAKKKEEAALKKQEALAKKAEEARLKQEEAAAKQAEISNVKEDDMALKEQEAKITEEARLKQEEMAKKKEEAALKKQEALAKKAEEARLKQEEMAKKKEEAALKKQEALAKKAEEARLKQEEAAAKQAEISNVKEDDMARKEQSNKKIESINELDPIFSTLSALKIEQMNLAKMKLSDDIETILETTIPLKPVNGANKDLTMDQIVFDQFLTSRTKKYPTCNDNKPSCRVIFFGPLYLNNDKANNDAYVEVIEKEIK